MKPILNKKREVTLVLIGLDMSDFERHFVRQPPSVLEKVIVLNYIDEETKKDALDACDVFVMPSRVDSLGLVYLEAWLYKKPVIGTYAGGAPEIIDDGENGFLVPFADIHMLREYIEIILENPSLAKTMGHNGYIKVMRQYTWKESCRRLQDIYKSLIG